jgi:hypothetical protein
MVAMSQTEYNSIAEKSIEELRAETPEIKTKLKHAEIVTR